MIWRIPALLLGWFVCVWVAEIIRQAYGFKWGLAAVILGTVAVIIFVTEEWE